MRRFSFSCLPEEEVRMTERKYRPGGGWTLDVGSWFLADGLLGFWAMNAAFALSPYSGILGHVEGTPHLGRFQASIAFAGLLAVTAHIFGLHNPLQSRQFWMLVLRCLSATLLSLTALAIFSVVVLYNQIGRYILFQSAVYAPLFMVLLRLGFWQYSGQRRQRILLLGGGSASQHIRELIQKSGVSFQIVASVEHRPELIGQNVESLAATECQLSLTAQCQAHRVDEVVTCIGGKISEESMRQLMECLGLGVRVSDFANFIERNFFQVPVENIRGEWFLQADLELSHPAYVIAKRGTDIFLSLLGLITFSPALLLAAAAIKLESRGPVFYSQIRSGLHNRPFKIWKLRSMRIDAEKDGPKWAAAKDNRITRIGNLLRRTRLDEVPQFWNILRGEMSLVGPRPERPEFVEKLAAEIPHYQQRHLVKPGLTGWAQINYPYGATTEDALCKLRYDLYYIKHASIGLDLQIALRTIGVAMKGSR
jgi:exopolysaccharide biosynthesis polyprenyl glycosylphosphotransferase